MITLKGIPLRRFNLLSTVITNVPTVVRDTGFPKCCFAKQKGHIYFAFRNFPLRNIHPHAQLAAEAAMAAQKQDQFWMMHDLLYENWNNLNKQTIVELADQINLDIVQFQEDINQHTFREAIARELKEGINYGVDGTPTFFINGNKYTGQLNYKEMQKNILNIL